MNTKITVAAIGVALLAGSTLARADGLHDLFDSLPHFERHADDRNDHHAPYLGWHREYRGFAQHDEYQRDRQRFEAHRGHDRDDRPTLAWHRHDRGDR